VNQWPQYCQNIPLTLLHLGPSPWLFFPSSNCISSLEACLALKRSSLHSTTSTVLTTVICTCCLILNQSNCRSSENSFPPPPPSCIVLQRVRPAWLPWVSSSFSFLRAHLGLLCLFKSLWTDHSTHCVVCHCQAQWDCREWCNGLWCDNLAINNYCLRLPRSPLEFFWVWMMSPDECLGFSGLLGAVTTSLGHSFKKWLLTCHIQQMLLGTHYTIWIGWIVPE
jgi:hypothetical protein